MKTATSTLVCCVALLVSLGMIILYSASMTVEGPRLLKMQLLWLGLGLAGALAASVVDYRRLRPLAPWILGGAAVLLVLVLIPQVGVKIKGARRWLDFGGPRLQPSELAKLGLILFLAWYGERYQRKMPTLYRGLLVPGVFVLGTLALIYVEPDRGTTILMGAVCGAILMVAGCQWKFMIPPVIMAGAYLAYSFIHDPMRIKRIMAWLYIEENKDGVAYQAYQAMLALGAGGWFGLGLGDGRQKLGFVPEHHTDFILSVIGEELGLMATVGVLLAFIAIVCCGIYIAQRARDTFGMLLAFGITFLVGLQAFINIGVVSSALPNKGMSLPFISYGGSNLLVMLIAVGLLRSVARVAEEDVPVATPEMTPNPQTS